MNFYKCNKKGANVQSSKTVTAGTSQQTVAPDTGYDAMGEVVVNPTPSQSKSVTAGTTTTTVTPDSGKLLSSVSIDPTPSTPITPSSSGTQFSAGLNDMSSSGWAYDSQQSGGTIKKVALKATSPMQGASTFTLSDNNYNLIKSGKAIIIACINDYSLYTPQYGNFGCDIRLGISLSDMSYVIIDSTNIGSSKYIYYRFSGTGQVPAGNATIYLVYID